MTSGFLVVVEIVAAKASKIIVDLQPPTALDNQALQSQFRIEYADSVSATNNYARTKKWALGVELIK